MTIYPRVGLTDIQVDNLNTNMSPGQAFITIDYHDGLGRPIQHVEKQASPQGKDIITLRRYNNYGKERRTYLPFPHPSQTSGYRINHTSGYNAAKDYYRENYNDENCISEIDFEKSPLFRVAKEGGFGQDWQISKGHAIEYYEGANNKQLLTTYDPRHFEWTENGIYKRDRFQNLELQMTADEDNNVHMQFFDKSDGKLMVERSVVSLKNMTTYYLYDDIGRLRAVLPPMLSYYMENKGSAGKFFPKNTDTLALYGYFYNYDDRGNCTEKYLPGLHDHPVYVVYDAMNRPVLTQDGELRKKNQWKYQKYDVLGRPCESGIHTTTTTFENLKTIVENQNLCYEKRTGKYYTNQSYPSASKTVLITNYYDDYEPVPELGFGVNFRGMLDPDEVEHSFDYEEKIGYSSRAASAKGQLTMSEVALLDGSKPMVSVFYYDEKGRLVQERSENRIGGYDYIFYELDFTGQILRQKHEHYSDFTNLFQTYYYAYDNQGRLIQISHGIDESTLGENAILKTLVIYSYDELGKLKTKSLYPGNQNQTERYKVDYDYHIRGGIKKISSPYFTETLYYGNEASRENALLSTSGYKAAYNGNIAVKITEGIKRAGFSSDDIYQFTYKYDELGQLKSAAYYNDYNNTKNKFSVSNMTYDRNGNILTLHREGITQKRDDGLTYSTGNVDELTYVYNGNQLQKINDANTTSWIYTGIQTYLPLLNPVWENTYDANGSLSFSGDNGLIIENNMFNLPKRVEDLDGNVVEIIYDASGQKVEYKNHSDNSQSKIYHRGMIFKSGGLTYMPLPEGYYDGNSYYAVIRDYLGSVRVVLEDNAANYNMGTEVKEVNHYDPWGVEFGMSMFPFGVQDYKHQGKERVNLFGKNYHDHGARLAFNVTSIWNAMDPLMEANYSISPYAYCNNNPVRYIDPDGRMGIMNDEDSDENDRPFGKPDYEQTFQSSISSNSKSSKTSNTTTISGEKSILQNLFVKVSSNTSQTSGESNITNIDNKTTLSRSTGKIISTSTSAQVGGHLLGASAEAGTNGISSASAGISVNILGLTVGVGIEGTSDIINSNVSVSIGTTNGTNAGNITVGVKPVPVLILLMAKNPLVLAPAIK